MRQCMRFGLMLGLTVLMTASRVFAQMNGGAETVGAADGPVPLYRSEASVVSLRVTVTDKSQHHVGGLAQENFAVFEDGRPQNLRYFAAEPTPLDLAILLDTSGSMGGTLREVQEAALELAAALRPDDRASFVEVKRGMNELHPLSADTAGLARAIRSTTSGGSTSLFNAVYVTLHTLQRAASTDEVRRQALVILSDGEDNSSTVTYDDMLDAVQRSGVIVYTVSLPSLDPAPATRRARSMSRLLMGDSITGDYVLRSVAEQTGGRAFFGLTSKDLARTCQQIATELANQYSLGYVSSNPHNDGRYRQIAVRVLTPAGVSARTRPGYFATATSKSTRSPRLESR
jgi:Ca-activated chloride channel homolog